MKKFTFLFVLFFCAKMAFGQWESIDQINSSNAQTIFKTNQSLFLISDRWRALYKSIDNGLTWEKKLIFPTLNNIYDGIGFVNIITKGDTILLCSFNSIYRSFNDGNSWSQTPTPSMSTNCFLLNDTMYSYDNFNWGCIYKSNNFGQTWVQDCSSAISNLNIASIINIDSNVYGIALLDTIIQLVKINNVESFEILDTVPYSILGFYATNQKIAYCNYNYHDTTAFISISNNQGLTWNTINIPYCPYSLTVKGDSIFVIYADSVVYSANDGLSWSKVTGIKQYKYFEKYDYINGIEYIYSSMGTLNRRTIFSEWESINVNFPSIFPWWLKVKNNHLFYSESVGYIRKPIGNSNDKLLRVYEDSTVFIDFIKILGNNMYSLNPNIGLLRSENNGDSWSLIDLGIPDLNLSGYSRYNMTERNDTLYLIISEYREAYYILMSVDDGINWTTIFSETNLNSWMTTLDYCTFFKRDNYLFVGFADQTPGNYRRYNIENGVISNYMNLISPTSFIHCIGDLIISNDYKSCDFGNTWISCGNGLPQGLYPIEYEFFGNDSILFCFMQPANDLFASLNQGDSWFSIKDNIQSKYIQAADLYNDTLFVIASYDSVYARSINDIAAICVSGKVFNDNNGNNEFDAYVDEPTSGIKVYSSSSNYTTNLYGDYFLFLSEYSNVDTIRILNSLLYSTVTPEYYIVNQADTSKNFAITRIPGINDLRVDITSFMYPIPGFGYSLNITCKNEGTTSLDANVSLNVDDLFTFQNSSEAPTNILGNVVNWSIPDFQPLQSKSFTVNLLLTNTNVLGEQISIVANISPILGDTTMENNTDSISDIVVGSYDPNDKTVNRAMYLSPQQVLNKSEMIYTVRFQNTGTWYAENVSILDTLHRNLDLNTFRVISASHDYNFDFSGNGIVRFNFPNINLPDSNMNEAASHGFIKYAVKLQNSIPLNDSITNTAHIFFDFNEAIVTNTTLNIVKIDAAINESPDEFNLNVYPNPAKTVLNIRFEKSSSYNLTLFSLDGRMVMNEKSNSEHHILNIASLDKGIYLLKVSDNNRSKIVKVVIQ